MKNERGSALLAVSIILFLVIGISLWYVQWTMVQSRGSVNQTGSQIAMEQAENAYNDARQLLKRPDLRTKLVTGGEWQPLSSEMMVDTTTTPDRRFAIDFHRSSADDSLIEATCTGYYYIASGNVVDVDNGNRKALQAVIEAKFKVYSAAQYLFAVPNTLTVNAGSDLSNGSIYARDLVFEPGAHTTVGSAYYYVSSSPTAPTNVTFINTGSATPLTSAANFGSLDSSIRTTYSAGTPQCTFDGLVSAPPGHVFYCNGTVDIAETVPLVVDGVYTIYATSNVVVHGNMRLNNSSSWIAVLSEQDVQIGADAPAHLTLHGNFVSNHDFVAEGSIHPFGTFHLNGSVAALNRIAIGQVWSTPGSRHYLYATSTDPSFLLPNFTQTLQYTVLQGKFSS